MSPDPLAVQRAAPLTSALGPVDRRPPYGPGLNHPRLLGAMETDRRPRHPLPQGRKRRGRTSSPPSTPGAETIRLPFGRSSPRRRSCEDTKPSQTRAGAGPQAAGGRPSRLRCWPEWRCGRCAGRARGCGARRLRRRGRRRIPWTHGWRWFLAPFLSQRSQRSRGGRRPARRAADLAGERRAASSDSSNGAGLLPGIELVDRHRARKWPPSYLEEHVFRGDALLPRAGREAMAQVAQVALGPGHHPPPVSRQLSFRPVVCRRRNARSSRVAALCRDREGSRAGLGTRNGSRSTNFRVTCRLPPAFRVEG